MHLIAYHDAPSMAELAAEMGYQRPTITGIIDRMRRNGMVERYHDEVDRRVVRVRLTEQGTKLSQDLHENGRAFLRTVFENMGAGASRRIAEDMTQFAAAINSLVESGSSPVAMVPSMFIGRVNPPYNPP